MLEIPAADSRADIGVFGGSGFYEFLTDVETVELTTPYGAPSVRPTVGSIGDRRVAFIARHGPGHSIPAHRVNFRANVWAMAALGVRALVGPFACGSLRSELAPGDVVVVDQLVDRTSGREGTFFDGPETWHQPLADPYDAELGHALAEAARTVGLTVHHGGTVVVISGPRFSTRAESAWHRRMGADLVNMTQAPEAALAAEAGLRYAGLGLVTDYDAGLDDDPSVAGVSQHDVFALLAANTAHLRDLLCAAVPTIDLGSGGEPVADG